jgi:hypothetical protein
LIEHLISDTGVSGLIPCPTIFCFFYNVYVASEKLFLLCNINLDAQCLIFTRVVGLTIHHQNNPLQTISKILNKLTGNHFRYQNTDIISTNKGENSLSVNEPSNKREHKVYYVHEPFTFDKFKALKTSQNTEILESVKTRIRIKTSSLFPPTLSEEETSL